MFSLKIINIRSVSKLLDLNYGPTFLGVFLESRDFMKNITEDGLQSKTLSNPPYHNSTKLHQNR